MRICVIFNPAARGEKAARFRQHLAEMSTQCTLKPTYAAGAGRALGAEAAREDFDIVVAAGGDGTVNEVLNGIVDVSEALGRVRFAVMPLGTVNVFAKELRMPTGFRAAWNVVLQGRETTIDLPEAEYTANGQTQIRCFAQMAGAGLDSRAIDLVDFGWKKKVGGLAYVMAGFKALSGPQPQIVVTDGKETHQGELVLIGNGRFYGGKYPLFPLADLRDGLLEVSVFPKVNLQGFARAGWGLLMNQLYTSGGAKHFKAAELQLYGSVPVPFHVEGENTGQLPAKFRIRPKALRVIVP